MLNAKLTIWTYTEAGKLQNKRVLLKQVNFRFAALHKDKLYVVYDNGDLKVYYFQISCKKECVKGNCFLIDGKAKCVYTSDNLNVKPSQINGTSRTNLTCKFGRIEVIASKPVCLCFYGYYGRNCDKVSLSSLHYYSHQKLVLFVPKATNILQFIAANELLYVIVQDNKADIFLNVYFEQLLLHSFRISKKNDIYTTTYSMGYDFHHHRVYIVTCNSKLAPPLLHIRNVNGKLEEILYNIVTLLTLKLHVTIAYTLLTILYIFLQLLKMQNTNRNLLTIIHY